MSLVSTVNLDGMMLTLDTEAYLKNYVQAHPGRSMYGFSIDSDRPGFMQLCFLSKSTKDGGVIQTWVSLAP